MKEALAIARRYARKYAVGGPLASEKLQEDLRDIRNELRGGPDDMEDTVRGLAGRYNRGVLPLRIPVDNSANTDPIARPPGTILDRIEPIEFADGGDVQEPVQLPEIQVKPDPQVSEEDIERARMNEANAPRQGGLLQTIPQFISQMSQPGAGAHLWEGLKQEAANFIPGMIAQASEPGRVMQEGTTTEQAVPWAAGMAQGMIGASPFVAEPGAIGTATRYQRPTKVGPEAAQYYGQTIADQLIENHVTRPNAIQEISDKLATLSPQAEAVVMQHLPQTIQEGVGIYRIQEADRILNPPGRGGFRDSNDIDKQWPNLSEGDIKKMSDDDINYLGNHMMHTDWTEYHNANPYALDALKRELDRRTGPPPDDLSIPDFLRRDLKPLQDEPTQPIVRGDAAPGTHPFKRMTNQYANAFEHYFPEQSHSDFAKQFFGGFDTRNINANTQFGHFTWSGELYDPATGKQVAKINRSIDPEGKTANHGYLTIDPAYRGAAGPQILRGQMDTYRQLGLREIHVSASLDGGGYAWARYGFIPNAEDWHSLSHYINRGLNDNGTVSTFYGTHTLDDPSVVPLIRRILQDPNPKSMWKLSDIAATVDGGKNTFGNAMLAGRSWDGTFRINDPESQARFDSYVEKKFERAKQKKKPSTDQ